MDGLVQFFTAIVVALAAMAFSHLGVAGEGLSLRDSEPRAERTVKRSPAPQNSSVRSNVAF